jgi:hypothetical protein
MEDPENPGTGFILIEIPESEFAPHMADGRYFGRSDSGRTSLTDDEVERLMLQRARMGQRIEPEMLATIAADPVKEADRRGVPHGFFTAVPTHGWPDMFAAYTRDRQAHQQLIQLASQAAVQSVNGTARDYNDVAMGGMQNYRRTSRPHGAWLLTDTDPREGIGRMVGVDDDGTIRLIDLAAGSTETGRHAFMDDMASQDPGYNAPMGAPCVYEMIFRARVTDMLHLVDELSRSVGYGGSWLLGVHLDQLTDRVAQATVGQRGFMAPGRYTADTYTFSSRATARQITDGADGVSMTLVRRLYRGLGTEGLLA